MRDRETLSTTSPIHFLHDSKRWTNYDTWLTYVILTDEEYLCRRARMESRLDVVDFAHAVGRMLTEWYAKHGVPQSRRVDFDVLDYRQLIRALRD